MKLKKRKCSSDLSLWEAEYLEQQKVPNAKLKKSLAAPKHIP